MGAEKLTRAQRDHVIKRHGGFFRPNACGYTREISDAGLYTKAEARRYLGVEGLTIHHISEYAAVVDAEILRLRASLNGAKRVRRTIRAAGRRALEDRNG